MKKIFIRVLKPCDLHVLTELFSYNDVSEMIASNKNKIENKTADIFCLYENERLIGELRAAYTHEDERFASDGKRAYLYALRIHEDFRNKGYGKYLLSEVISLLYEKGYKEYTIGVEEDNHRAMHIYKQMGFDEFVAVIDEEYQGDKYSYNLYCLKK